MSAASLPEVAIFDNYWASTLAFARSLGRRGVPLRFIGNGAGRWSRFRTSRASSPPVEDAARFEPWLVDSLRQGTIARIAPTSDLIAYYMAKHRDEFPADVRRAITPLAEMEDCLIKTRFAGRCAIAGQPALPTAAPDDLAGALAVAETFGYPVIMKPKSHLVAGFAERGSLIESRERLIKKYYPYPVTPGQESLAERYPELLWPMIQRYVPTARQRVYSVSGIKDSQGGIITAAVSYKSAQWPAHVGVSTVQVGCDDPRLLEAGLQVVDRLMSRGLFEIELLTEGEHVFAIDLNPRAFGFLALDMARGMDLPWLWYRATRESSLAPLERKPDPAFEARHGLLRLLQRLGGSGARSQDSTVRRATVSMLGHWSDPLPMLLCHLQLLRHPRILLRAIGGARMPAEGQAKAPA